MTPFKYIIIFTICIILCKTSYAQSDAIKFEVIEKIAQTEYHPTFSAVTAKLLEGINPKLAYGQLDTLLGREYGDMFWMYGCAGLYFSCKNILPVSYKQKIRECWKHFTPYRGDTENHFLMYYGSLFLFSEEWDSLDASEWFMGRSSQEINAESKEWLLYWIHETVRTGMTEFDSPRYLYYYITPLVLLSEYSRDSAIRSKSEMMLEYLLANYSVKYLGGSYCGAHSRDANESTLVPSNTEAASYGEYFFEDSITHILPDIVFVAATSYVLPEIIREIAHKRNNSFECTEIVRSRRRVRYEIPAVKSIHKYTYMARDYALGSLESGIAQPIQQRTWSLVLRSQNPYSVIAGLHPYYSAKELGTFFPEEPSFMLEKIEAVKAGYTSEDKWVGASPYETVWQRRNELRCSYDIPKDAAYHHVDLFIPDWGEFLEVDSTVWHEVKVQFNTVSLSINTATDFSLSKTTGGYRLRLKTPRGKTAYWLFVNDGSETDERDPFMFKGQNSILPSTDRKWLIRSPYLESKFGSGVITIRDGDRIRVLDFN